MVYHTRLNLFKQIGPFFSFTRAETKNEGQCRDDRATLGTAEPSLLLQAWSAAWPWLTPCAPQARCCHRHGRCHDATWSRWTLHLVVIRGPTPARRPRQCVNNAAAANTVAQQRQVWRRDGVGKRAGRRADPGRGGAGARRLLTRWRDEAERDSALTLASLWRKRSRGGGDRNNGDQLGDDAVVVDAAVDAAAMSARRQRARQR